MKKLTIKITVLLALAVLLLGIAACDGLNSMFEDLFRGRVVSVEVDQSTLPSKILEGEFFLNSVKVEVKYKNGDVDYVTLGADHFAAAELDKLQNAGNWNVAFSVFDTEGSFAITVIKAFTVKSGEFTLAINSDCESFAVSAYSGDAYILSLPESCNGLPVTSIADKAFYGCGFTFVNIPQSITKIGAYAFGNCENLEYMYVPASVRTVGRGFITNDTGVSQLNTVHFAGDLDAPSVQMLTGSTIMSINIIVEQKNSLYDVLSAPIKTSTGTITLTVTTSLQYVNKTSTTSTGYIEPIDSIEVTQPRSASYNGFASETGNDSYPIDNSEQLMYAVLSGFKPVFRDNNSQAALIYAKAKDILRSVVDDSMTDVQKLTAIHDYLALSITYDGEFRDKAMAGALEDVNAYRCSYLEGALLDEIAVCDGFAKAFLLLCSMEGFDCRRVEGTHTETIGTLQEIGHAWNKVLLGEEWFLVDVTKDVLYAPSGANILTHGRFLLNDISTLKIHNTSNPYTEKGNYPSADGSYDYYMENGLYVINRRQLVRLFTDASVDLTDGKSIELMFADSYMSEIVEQGGLASYMGKVLKEIEFEGNLSLSYPKITLRKDSLYVFCLAEE
ncbi:MAG: leucine-rich repeat protein [Clostridia bacterium]|nr:leucine-rich repeat protein [Clostridia bacterium]